MTEGKTSTFVLHHDRCKPGEWGLALWQALADFARTGDLRYAATLSRAGMQLVVSENHEAVGGTLQHIGYVSEAEAKTLAIDDLGDICDDDDVAAVVPIYRGPTKYVVAYSIVDDDGFVEDREYEIKDTEAEAIDGGGCKVCVPATTEKTDD